MFMYDLMKCPERPCSLDFYSSGSRIAYSDSVVSVVAVVSVVGVVAVVSVVTVVAVVPVVSVASVVDVNLNERLIEQLR